MPYKSKAQARWAHSEAGSKALGGEKKVAEWDNATKGKKLPERIGPTKLQKAKSTLRRGMEGKKR